MAPDKQEDHDILIEIKTDVKHLVQSFITHQSDDKAQFKSLTEGQEILKKAMWTALGAITVMTLAINWFFK